MADFAADLIKIVSDKKITGKGGKVTKKRKLGPKSSDIFEGTSSSPGVGSSSQGGTKVVSPNVMQKAKPATEEIPLVDLEMEKPFLLPKVVSDKDFLDKNPLQVAAVEKAAILRMDQEVCRDQMIEDATGLLRLLEKALFLNEDRQNRADDLAKLKAANTKLEAENMALENEVVDLRGKKENFVAQAKENRELKGELAKFSEERKRFEEEISRLKLAMAPAEDETDNTKDLSTRAELVARVRKLGDSVLAGMKHGWQNAISQIKVVNPGVELSLEGMGVFREVADGRIVLPERYKDVEAADLAGEDDMDAEDVEDEEEDKGESRKTLTPPEDD
jgi:cell division protein FtsB